jgi:hypothetical protein
MGSDGVASSRGVTPRVTAMPYPDPVVELDPDLALHRWRVTSGTSHRAAARSLFVVPPPPPPPLLNGLASTVRLILGGVVCGRLAWSYPSDLACALLLSAASPRHPASSSCHPAAGPAAPLIDVSASTLPLEAMYRLGRVMEKSDSVLES